jgi:uncharacterized membrane protein HdeD (DUF308 family)
MLEPQLTTSPGVAAGFRRYWWLFLIRGLVALGVGVFALFAPAATLAALVFVIGAYLLIDGAVTVVKAIQVLRSDAHWWVLLLEGIVGLVAGALILLLPGLSIVSLALLVGYWAIISGVFGIAGALRMRAHVPGEWLYLLFAVVSIVFGVVVVMSPATGLAYIVIMISIYGFVSGVTLIGLAFRARSLPA